MFFGKRKCKKKDQGRGRERDNMDEDKRGM